MNTKYGDHLFPAPIREQREFVERTAQALSDQELEWLSINRDFAESERYSVKDAVDESLVESAAVTSERTRIEDGFANRDPVLAAGDYLADLRQHLVALHQLHSDGLTLLERKDVAIHLEFWASAAELADTDNAHAMYLSSHNWSFSVFDRLIEEMSAAADSPELLSALLTGGVSDVRTSVHGSVGRVYAGLTRSDFVATLRRRSDWVRPDGVMPLFAYKIAVEPTQNLTPESTLSQRFDEALRAVKGQLDGERARRFERVMESFVSLYLARAAYDVYEYFGFYSFARHLLILKTMQLLRADRAGLAEEFRYQASTYQFVRLSGILKRVANGDHE